MPSLSVEIKTTRMVTSTKLFRMVAGIENVYYALLFTGIWPAPAPLVPGVHGINSGFI